MQTTQLLVLSLLEISKFKDGTILNIDSNIFAGNIQLPSIDVILLSTTAKLPEELT